ncbi:hypothetical protein CPAR01_02675 [Colletotrichum paranaense]|uniref:Integral membrane protein n=1 Tax=Colletotrichum paranaense TaxID=1914294 RepID=A0ABQ9T076_9PEZI|nr:uncharacterized protein CPAR01_02675 [Colletotrichum paranaense]KAK1545173.1 hypothetical protein CPAR01_02675 [Colletotrichum paranaense]
MVKACLPRIVLLCVLASLMLAAVAAGEGSGRRARWVNNGGDHRSPAEPQRRRRRGAGHDMAEDLLGKRVLPPTASTDDNKPARLEDRVVLSVPTPAALFGRQAIGNPIDAINSASRSAQQAIASASQSAREAIQQANDQVRQAGDRQRQAEEQARQANDAATRASISANNAVVQAQASAKEGILNAQNAAKESASKQVADNFAMVTASAQTQLASQVASIQASASASAAQAIAVATQSASAAISNAQQQAQQQIQAARVRGSFVVTPWSLRGCVSFKTSNLSTQDDANLRVSQAQGAAVSVTQAALAVVGAIIGSSLLTILGFYIFTRYRRNKRKDQTARELRREISYPKQNTLMTTNALAINNGYPQDVKRPISPTRPETARTTGSSGGMGYAVSDFGDGQPNFSRQTTFVSSTAPQMGMGTIQREQSVSRRPVPPSPKKPPYSLFPPRSRDGTPATSLPATPAPARDREKEAPPPLTINPGTGPPPASVQAQAQGPANNEKLDRVDEESDEFGEGTKNWLRRTQTVSPFGDLADTPTREKDPNWPFARSNSPPPPTR